MTTSRHITRGRWLTVACLTAVAFGLGLSTSSFFAQTKPEPQMRPTRVNEQRKLLGDMFASGSRGADELRYAGLDLEAELTRSHHLALAEFHKKALDLNKAEANVDEVSNFIQQEAARFRSYLAQAQKRSQSPEQMKKQHDALFSYIGNALATVEDQNRSTKRMLKAR